MKNYYKELFNNLLLSYYITIEHQFIYDELLNHLILDCENYIEKNYNPIKNRDIKEYSKLIFKTKLYNHIKSREWFDKIYNPDKCPEVIKRVRKNKLNQIYGSK